MEKQPVKVVSLEGNPSTPVYVLYSDDGEVLASGDGDDLMSRFEADTGEPMPEELETTTLPAEGAQTSRLDLWSYVDPVEAGSYLFGFKHKVTGKDGSFEESNRVAFEVVPAEVTLCLNPNK